MNDKSKFVETFEFSKREDKSLALYLSIHSIPETRRAAPMYASLGPRASDDLGWSRSHYASTWQARYLSNTDEFDAKINKLVRKREDQEREERARQARLARSPPVIKTVGSRGASAGGSVGETKRTRKKPYPLPPRTAFPAVTTTTAASTSPTRSRTSAPKTTRAPPPSPTPSVAWIQNPVESTPQAQSTRASPCPLEHTCTTCSIAAAEAAAAVHIKLTDIARNKFDGMFSIDLVWKAYADMGGHLGLVEDLLDEMKQEIDAMFVKD